MTGRSQTAESRGLRNRSMIFIIMPKELAGVMLCGTVHETLLLRSTKENCTYEVLRETVVRWERNTQKWTQALVNQTPLKGKDKGKGYHNKSHNSKGDKGKSNGKYGKGYGFQQNQGKGGGGWSTHGGWSNNAKARATTASPTTARATRGNPRGNPKARASPRIPTHAVSVVSQIIGETSAG